jgi:hypothetical protein
MPVQDAWCLCGLGHGCTLVCVTSGGQGNPCIFNASGEVQQCLLMFQLITEEQYGWLGTNFSRHLSVLLPPHSTVLDTGKRRESRTLEGWKRNESW